MGKLETLKDGLVDEVKDLYNAEHQLLKALPKMEKKATNEKLKKTFRAHLEETKGQVQRLEKIGQILEVKMTGKVCKAMKGLIEEGKEVIDEKSKNAALLDALLIGAARRVEHYEMAAYCTARGMAKELGEDAVYKLLDETFSQESGAEDKLVALLAEVLPDANNASEQEAKPLKKAA